jgi:hypothetical protein
VLFVEVSIGRAALELVRYVRIRRGLDELVREKRRERIGRVEARLSAARRDDVEERLRRIAAPASTPPSRPNGRATSW